MPWVFTLSLICEAFFSRRTVPESRMLIVDTDCCVPRWRINGKASLDGAPLEACPGRPGRGRMRSDSYAANLELRKRSIR